MCATNWNARTKPSTDWSQDRDDVGDFRITQAGDFRITQDGLFYRITQLFSWITRTKPSTNWSNRVKP